MPERIAKVEQEYAGRKVTVGERFEVEEGHVALLLEIGRIEPEEGEPGYVARELTADESPVYRTREMKPKKKRLG
jgi:hypothetical protein